MSLGILRVGSFKFTLEMGEVHKIEEKGNLNSDHFESPLMVEV